jgi:chemotaxis protein CheC
METTHRNFEQELYLLLKSMADEGIRGAQQGLSMMVGESLEVTHPEVRRMALVELPEVLGGPESEVVGIYLRVNGQISGQIMMIIPYEKALELADLVLCNPPGTCHCLERLERSALAELGNLTTGFFLNSIAASTGLEARPSPPAVMVDMLGAIIDVILTGSDGLGESVLVIQATFMRGERELQVEFWLLPDRNTLDSVASSD